MQQNKKGLENVGGQAVMEGVMMKSDHFYSIAIRKNDGSISISTERFISYFEKHPKLKIPIIRGVIGLLETMVLGIKTLMFSANETQDKEEDKMTPLQTFGVLATSISLSVLLFILAPLALTYLVKWTVSFVDNSDIMFNLVDGVFKIGIFLLYVYFASLIPDIHRLFQYHGAEHKSIYNFESGKELKVENARDFTTLHPRCGTSFLVFVLIISVFIFSIIPTDMPFYINFMWRIPLIPLIAGIGYEVLKASARHKDKLWMKIMIWPGLQVQRITTKNPTDDMLEVGLASLNAVAKAEREWQAQHPETKPKECII
jgi:uncharacterized protein YqhQ